MPFNQPKEIFFFVFKALPFGKGLGWASKISQVYTSQYNFFYTSRGKFFRIPYYISNAIAAAFAPGHWYGTKRAIIIAAILYF